MTHNELLVEIDTRLEIMGDKLVSAALRAVVELHKPTKDFSVEDWCDVCTDYYGYPCPTIQAIEKELG